MYCYSDTATNSIDTHAGTWMDLGLEVTFNVSAPPNIPIGIPISFCATTSFTTNSGATTAVRVLVDGQPADPVFEGRIKYGSGEKGPITLSGCTNLTAGSHTVKVQFQTEGSGNSCFSGTRFLTALA